MLYIFLVILAVQTTVLCKSVRRYAPHFDNGRIVTNVTSHYIKEASGVCASRIHKDVLYTHNDSGGTHRIFAISAISGDRLATITIDGASAHDWEDIACGPCPGGSGHCIYIADTGGNVHGGEANMIYRIKEPSEIHGSHHIHVDSILQFSWDQNNCETVMVDNRGEVYVLSKVHSGNHPKFVRLPRNAWGTNHSVQVNEGINLKVTSPLGNPVGGDISLNGKEVLVKSYYRILYWYVPDGDYYTHLVEKPVHLPYIDEPQGEAICFDAHGGGYYTMTEGLHPPIYYYRRQGQIPSEITG